jgi:hypothetical protein
MAVVPSLSDIHGYDQSVFSIRRYLRVVTRRKTAAGLLHHTRLGITGARACLAFFFRRLLRLAQLFQFHQSLFQPFSLFSRRSLPRRLLAPIHRRLRQRVSQRLHLQSRSLHMFPQSLLATKRLTARLSLNLRPVLHHFFQSDQAFRTQHPQQIAEQLMQLLPLLHPEIRQRVIVHRFDPRQPLKRWIVFTPPLDLSGRSDSTAVGVHPQAD